MAFGFGGEKRPSPSSSLDQAQNYLGANDDYPTTGEYDDDLHVPCPPHTTERKLVRRIDFHVIPFLCIMYLLAFLDRVNIANANVFGLSPELGLDKLKYNTALVIFFVPYVLFEIPSNVLLKKFTPHVWLSANMFLFGFTTMMQGLVQSYSGLLATRFFLGLFETGLIFILEGALTVAVAFAFYFLISDFPEEAKWLKADERAYVAARLRADQGRSARERPIKLKDVGNVFKDYKVVVAGFMYFGLIVPAYGYAYFAPGIISGYGYSKIQTQLHSVPPWAAAFGFAMLMAFLSDWAQHRFAFAVFSICVSVTGFGILLGVHDNTQLQYAALFLVTMGTYTAMPIIVCWFNMNLGGHHRRSVGSAWQIGFGNIGGIIATFAFLDKDAPRFIPGYSISIAFTILSISACIVYGLGCMAANKKREKPQTNLDLTEEQKTELGDLNPDYRYLL